MLTRRQLLQVGGLGLLAACRSSGRPAAPTGGVVLNDIHSRLNATRVAEVRQPVGLEELRRAVLEAGERELAVSIAGGRHAMGGQQFGAGALHLDTRGLDRVLGFDPASGRIEVEAGIQWPALIDRYLELQADAPRPWGIAQKQTGADRLSLGGALAANVHGRGLTLTPLVGDIESFTLLDGHGELRSCSRRQNPELFRLAVGGYGLFGVVYSIVLRLTPRRKLERIVEVRPIEGLSEAVAQRVDDGFLYGDFQFKTDSAAPDFLQHGVFSCYRPVADDAPMPATRRSLGEEDWLRLLRLAHFDKARGFEEYAGYYLTTHGQLYWSDTHQLSFYADDYHSGIDHAAGSQAPGSEMISEVYVPRAELAAFLGDTAEAFRAAGVDVIYGTVRFIEKDEETFLPWATDAWAAIVFNLHVDHSPAGIERAGREFRSLIDLARRRGGSYFLTYHRWATREQVDACYPRMAEFLEYKLTYDPDERFQSEWYRHYKAIYAEPA